MFKKGSKYTRVDIGWICLPEKGRPAGGDWDTGYVRIEDKLIVFMNIGIPGKTGLITAESTAKSNAAMKFWLGIAEVTQTTADAFIEEINGKTKVRINFINMVKQSSSWGQDDRQDKQILDPAPYQNAFEKVENAIFVRSGS